MERLYALTDTSDVLKRELYVKAAANNSKDYFTYFNSFPLKQWLQYTTIQNVTVRMEIRGYADIIFYCADKKGVREFCRQESIGSGIYCKTFEASDLAGDIIGFHVVLHDDDSAVLSGAYYGAFSHWHSKRIGVGICTYCREDYVRRTINVLTEFADDNPWMQILVVDNGQTLDLQGNAKLRIIPNRNFGGSGGFARALVEYVSANNVDYVLLMDDDIVIEPSVLERTHALVSGLKETYRNCFIGGAMLSLEQPTIQYENTASWNHVKLHSYGRNLDLAVAENLVRNMDLGPRGNTYAAWWYCCMPLERIKRNGYPLPLFVKGDDMEYGMRNHQETLCMNGIGVWHETFGKKDSLRTRYFTSRNMFILNHFSKGHRKIGQILAVLGRLLHQTVLYGPKGAKAMYLSLRDYCSGPQELVKIGGDIKAEQIAGELERPLAVRECYGILQYFLYSIVFFDRLDSDYQKFYRENLLDDKFWRDYMKIGKETV